MNNGFWRHLPTYFVAATVFLSYYALKRVLNTSGPKFQNESLNYEMPRPEATEMDYDLSARQIVFQGRNKKSKGLMAAAGTTKPAVPPAGQPQNKAAIEAAKKRAAEAEKAKKKAQAAAIAKKKQEKEKFEKERKSALMAQMENDLKNKSKSAHLKDETNYGNGGGAIAVQAYPQKPNEPVVAAPVEDNVPHLSATQWRNLLSREPNVKNANDFLEARQKGAIDKNSFYQVTRDLIGDNSADVQKMVIYLLRRTPSEESFTVLVEHYDDKRVEPIKPQIESAIAEYGTPLRFNILARLLASPNAQVVGMAQIVLRRVIVAQGTSQPSPQGRDSRSPGSAQVPPDQLQSFVPVLEKLLNSPDQTLAQQAQALIDSIKALQPV